MLSTIIRFCIVIPLQLIKCGIASINLEESWQLRWRGRVVWVRSTELALSGSTFPTDGTWSFSLSALGVYAALLRAIRLGLCPWLGLGGNGSSFYDTCPFGRYLFLMFYLCYINIYRVKCYICLVATCCKIFI